MHQRKAVLILGMHRSGTSAVARVVNLLGAAAPRHLMRPDEFSPRGYWESKRINAASDLLLASVGSSWHDSTRLSQDRVEAAADKYGHGQRIKNVIDEEFGDAALFVLKDPRICRFVPLMLSIFDEMDIHPVAILPVRNPLEVAASLRKRDGFARPKSLLLWLRHVLDAEYASRGLQRFFLHYKDLLLDWRECLGHAASTGIALPQWSREAELEIDRFVTAELRRERATATELNADPEIGSSIKESYAILSSIAASGESRSDLDRLDVIRGKFDEACEVMGSAVMPEAAEPEPSRRERKLMRKLAEATAEREVLPSKGVLTGRVLWRAGQPLRALGAAFPRAATFLRRLKP